MRRALNLAGLVVSLVGISFPAYATTISFTAPITSAQNVSDAGTTVQGTIQFDPLGAVATPCGTGCVDYTFANPADTFTFTTDGGFSLTKPLTYAQVYDKFANGLNEGYVWRADFMVGSASGQLFLSFSNNAGNLVIANTDFPTSLNPADFNQAQAGYILNGTDFFNTGAEIFADVDGVQVTSAVPVPPALPLFAGGLGLMGWMARRKRRQAAYA